MRNSRGSCVILAHSLGMPGSLTRANPTHDLGFLKFYFSVSRSLEQDRDDSQETDSRRIRLLQLLSSCGTLKLLDLWQHFNFLASTIHMDLQYK